MSIALNTIAVILSNIIIRASGTVTLFATRRLLGPENTGAWNLIQLVTSYAVCANSGVELGAELEIPYWRGKGNRARESQTRNQMFSAVLLESLLVTLILMGIAALTRGHYRAEITRALWWGAAYVALWRLAGCFLISLRTLNSFVLLGRAQIVLSIFDFFVVIPLVYQWRLLGQSVAFGISFFARVIYFIYLVRAKRLFEFHWVLERSLLWSLWKVGFPLMINSLLFQFLVSIDSLIVAKRLGTLALGFYSLGWSASRAVSEIPNAFSSVVFPRLMEDFGNSDNPQALAVTLRRNLEASAFCLIPPIICVVYFTFPFLSRHFLPRFVPAIPTLKVLIMSGFVLSLTHLPAQVFMAHKKIIHFLGIMLGASLLVTGISWFTTPFGIWYVAVVVLLGYTAYFSALVLYAFWNILGHAQAVRTYLLLIGGITYVIGTMAVIDKCTPWRAVTSLGWDLAGTLANIGLSLLLLFPVFWKANRDLGIFERLKRLWLHKI